MNIDNIYNIYKNIYNDNGYIDNLDVRFYVQSDPKNDAEILKCDIAIYDTSSLEICDLKPLFQIDGNLGGFFLDFINLDTNYIKQLLTNLELININDQVTLGYIAQHYNNIDFDLYENSITHETITNPYIIDSSITVIKKLFKLHPYFYYLLGDFCRINLLKEYPLDVASDLVSLIKELEHINNLISECRKVIDFTFGLHETYSALNHFDNLTRYYIYTEYMMNPRSSFSNLPHRHFEFVPSPPPAKIIMGADIEDIIDAFANTTITFEAVYHLDIRNGSDTCAESILSLIQNNKILQKCKLCNKYYFIKGKYKSIYCNNKYKDSGRTCRQIAASNNHKVKTLSNPILREYERAYKRNYARLSNHKLTNEEFRLWVEEATRKREDISCQYKLDPSEELLLGFKKYLGNK